MDIYQEFDAKIFGIIHGLSGNTGLLDNLLTIVASDYLIPVGMGLTLFYIWFHSAYASKRLYNQKVVVNALTHMAFSSFIVLLINQFLFVNRPFVSYEIDLLFYAPTDSSFPSNPAAGTFAILIQACRLRSKAIIIMMTIMCLSMSLCRIAVGVHYPSDILGGYTIALVSTPFIVVIAQKTTGVQNLCLRKLRALSLA